eukprot:TRINITY_DN1485_c0_g1_i3.p1 TRINITY_DN1485_c0_g1~~TRINITY_DN1485_c0_g1_i3.p1  ORF type:complete len:746 (-),score=212.22 TRINITY_DN1485_c0_g1_i3:70-2307(-)
MLARRILTASARHISVGRHVARSHGVRSLVSVASSGGGKQHSYESSSRQKYGWFAGAAIGAGALLALSATTMTPALAQDVPNSQDVAHNKSLFDKYASVDKAGVRYLTPDDFLKAVTSVDSPNAKSADTRMRDIDVDKFRVLFRLADTDKTGLITFEEFQSFQTLLTRPDADYMLAFRLFDKDSDGTISRSEFKQVVSTTLSDRSIPYDFDSELMQMYFGKNNELTYQQFTQLLKDVQQDRVRQEFRYYDKNSSGYVPADKFAKILSSVRLRTIPAHIKDNLTTVADLNKGTPHEGQVSYGQFTACNGLLLHIPSYGRVLRAAVQKSGRGAVTKEEFLREAHNSTSIEITPMEVDLIFHLFGADKEGKLTIRNFEESSQSPVFAGRSVTGGKGDMVVPAAHARKTVGQQTIEAIENFALGAVAGAVGASAVYPIDLVKTRMQNQRTVDPTKRVYANSWDCFKKVLKNEGFKGLYRGLGPQCVGVAPEKAIKLTMNDLLRNLFEDKSKGEIYFPLEVLAGGGAGASQVLFTNPLEIVKIRLQVQGEGGKLAGKGAGAVSIVRELGLVGLYKGAGACLLRDIPFSAIYFPTYAKMKQIMMNADGKLGAKELLLSGAVAGIPAAYLCTPADVIKTRLQVKARAGEQTYEGIRDCFSKVLREEGPKAFFKGGIARVCRSSPQFGVTLFSYEMLQRFFAPHITPRPPTNAPVAQTDFESMWAGTAVAKVVEMEKKFGGLVSGQKDDKKKN